MIIVTTRRTSCCCSTFKFNNKKPMGLNGHLNFNKYKRHKQMLHTKLVKIGPAVLEKKMLTHV